MALFRLVTLDEARDHLRYDGSAFDARILRLVNDASQIVMDYIGSSLNAEGWTDSSGVPLVDANGDPLAEYLCVDSSGTPILDSSGHYCYVVGDAFYDSSGNIINGGRSVIPGPIRAATLLVLGALDQEHEGIGGQYLDHISPAVVSLLERFRAHAIV